MTANNMQPATHWDQSEFEILKSTWPEERIAADEKTLQDIFKLSARVPTLKQALDWANTHDIKFFVDYTATGYAGYYYPGTGVFGIVKEFSRSPETAVRILVHEIRHAWQDYHGYSSDLPDDPNVATRFIRTSLKEADADAFGKRAADEFRLARLKRLRKDNPERAELETLQSSLANPAASLGEKFLSWFSDTTISSHRRITELYGDALSKRLGRRLRLYEGPLQNHHCEFSPKHIASRTRVATINVHDMEDILKLGKGFSGTGNYLAALPPDILPKKVLRPSLADTFWEAADDNQKKLTTELRKTCLRTKLAYRLRRVPSTVREDWTPKSAGNQKMRAEILKARQLAYTHDAQRRRPQNLQKLTYRKSFTQKRP